ncbi:MAG TPA: GNAT family N-acetyltransferase [Anaerolineales bacterium]|nr:GNAT family N-acetyltransferase [Anaerolineales bacterium]
MKLQIEPIDPLHEEAIYLLHEAAREIRPLYNSGQDPNLNLPTNEPLGGRSAFLIARVDGKPVGCAALRPIEGDIAELRRMYVLISYRGQGIAQKLMEEIEKVAIEFKYIMIRLETGNRQLRAIALYKACGYQRIEPFGPYVGDPTSVCFEKRLSGPERGDV